MKKTFRISLIAAGLALAGTAHAVADPSSFQTVADQSFVEYFSVTPTATNKLILVVSGLSSHYSSLSFKFLDGAPAGTSFAATLSNGNWTAAFNDIRNGAQSLTGGTAYKFEIDGVTVQNPAGGFGIVSITSTNGAVTPVPEPESYAMLLAGLGLMGTIARRRSKSKAV